MGGEIGAESVKGQGSHFWVRLPCPPGTCTAPRQAIPELDRRRVLVYDANPLIRRSLRSMLVAWGAQVFNTGSWNQVLALLCGRTSSTRFDTVVLGLSASECRPQPLARNIQELRQHHRGLVVLLTGSEDWVPPDAIRTDPDIDWSTKPVRRGVLRRLLADRRNGVQPATASAPETPGRLHGMQILVAEDNAFNRELLREILHIQGADIDEAVSGDAAIAAALHGGYDVVLMDLHMPEIDGAEAARRIRAAMGPRTPPIWALTADVFGQTDLGGSEGCFDDWLLKPIDPESLVGRLVELRERHGNVPAKEASTPAAEPAPLPPEIGQRYREEVRALIGSLRVMLENGDRSGAEIFLHDLEGIVGLFGGARRVGIVRRLASDFGVADRIVLGALLDELEDCATRHLGGEAVDTT
jgi:CheY-like chemotaxis protein